MISYHKFTSSAALLLVLLTACAGTQQTVIEKGGRSTITIMTFNVENLFDTAHDAGKNDSTFLPLAAKQSNEHRQACAEITVERWRDQCLNYDWSESALQLKMAALARAILQLDDGRGPDILVLQEVENVAVVDRLRTDYLAAAGYRPAILIEGHDLRGIDVAFLTRLAVVGQPILHDVAFDGAGQSRVDDTRGILEATFRLPDGALLTGYAVHFPAPFHPFAMREQAYTALNELADTLPTDRLVFAAGDFNTPSEEDAEENMLDRFVRPRWIIAHDSCDACPGTYYYPPKGWSFLDMILWSRRGGGGKTTWHLRADATRLVNRAAGQTTAEGTPNRFELPAGSGISDHWPLAVTIESVAKQ